MKLSKEITKLLGEKNSPILDQIATIELLVDDKVREQVDELKFMDKKAHKKVEKQLEKLLDVLGEVFAEHDDSINEVAGQVKSFADKSGKSVAEVEKLWNKAKEIALEKFKESEKQFYPYLVGVLKKMLKID